jgi:hypothetical protein
MARSKGIVYPQELEVRMNKLNGEVVIELTRRCNMSCEHCLRGEPENMDISPEYMTMLLDRFDYISAVTFTGGEPSLKPNLIDLFFEIADGLNVAVGNFYIVTNAVWHDRSPEFLMSCLNAYACCEDNEVSLVQWSDDIYHEDQASDRMKKMIKALSFGKARGDSGLDRTVLHEGRADNWGGEKPEGDLCDCDDDGYYSGLIYLNCDGLIIEGCDFSYENQPNHAICHVSELTQRKLEEFVQKKFPPRSPDDPWVDFRHNQREHAREERGYYESTSQINSI